MLDDMRKYVRAGLEALSSPGAEDVATALVSRAQGAAEQLSALASGVAQWTAEARSSLLREVRDLVTRQVEEMGLATKKDLDALGARVDRIEGRTAASSKRAGGAAPAWSSKAVGRGAKAKTKAATPRSRAGSRASRARGGRPRSSGTS